MSQQPPVRPETDPVVPAPEVDGGFPETDIGGFITAEHSAQPSVQDAPAQVEGAFEKCHECGAPMSLQQRYCVECASRRPGANNPASMYFAAATRWRRRGGVKTGPEVKRVGKAAAVAALALIPAALAVGVFIGRGNSGSGVDEEALLAALGPGAGVAQTGTTGTDGATTETVADKVLQSDFTLKDGYTVKLELLPVSSTTEESVAASKSSAEGKGASDVGLINPSDFLLKPDQGTENYILYSGEFKSKGEADKALKTLQKDFPKAEVLSVKEPKKDGLGVVVGKTRYGVIRDVTRLDPTDKEIDKATSTVKEIATDTGQSYIDKQKELPDVIPIGGTGGGSGIPSGSGD